MRSDTFNDHWPWVSAKPAACSSHPVPLAGHNRVRAQVPGVQDPSSLRECGSGIARQSVIASLLNGNTRTLHSQKVLHGRQLVSVKLEENVKRSECVGISGEIVRFAGAGRFLRHTMQ